MTDIDSKAKRSNAITQIVNKYMTINDIKVAINRHIINKWQFKWTITIDNKLRVVKCNVTKWMLSKRATRREEMELTRLRIGHTRLHNIKT